MALRGSRGTDAVRGLGVPDVMDADAVIARALALAGVVPTPRIEVRSVASAARPAARGRYLAGTMTLYPAAFADPLTLAWTVLHELAHANGLGEADADAFAARYLSGASP